MANIANAPERLSEPGGARRWLGDAVAALKRALIKTGRALAGAYRAMQQARLAAVLANLSDERLREIGITRSEIWTYVEKITEGDFEEK